MSTARPSPYAQEPYRVLFPLGLIYVALGLILWLAGSQVPGLTMPTLLHMALVLVGMLGAITAGFIMTMVPQLLQGPAATWAWTGSGIGLALLGLVALALGILGLHAVLLAAWALLILCFVASRLTQAQRWPPPRMVLAAVALFSALVAGVLVLLAHLQVPISGWMLATIHDLGNHGILLLLVAAIAGYLLPRLAKVGKADPQCLAPEAGKAWQYAAFLILGLAVVLCYAGQRWVAAHGEGFASPAHYGWGILRALLMSILLAPALWLRGSQPAWLRCAQTAIYSLLIGLWGAALHPQLAVSWLHLVFVGGFLLLILLIAARVISAHAGQPEILDRGRAWVITLTILIHTGSLSRMGAEWAPRSYDLHLILGSVFALVAMLQWAWRYGPLLRRIPEPLPAQC